MGCVHLKDLKTGLNGALSCTYKIINDLLDLGRRHRHRKRVLVVVSHLAWRKGLPAARLFRKDVAALPGAAMARFPSCMRQLYAGNRTVILNDGCQSFQTIDMPIFPNTQIVGRYAALRGNGRCFSENDS